MVKYLPEFEYFTVFLKNKNIIFKIRRSKVTDYAALKEESCNLIDCFFINFMKANPTKCHAICIGKRARDDITSLNIDSAEIKCEDNVTLLGINVDFMLRFDDHVSHICKRASKQLTVLKQISRF